MRIKKIHIIGFGGMKNCELMLDDNFNLIHGSNEYGKTTLFSFIRAMLFGLKGNNKSIQNDYNRYMPIDNPHNFKGEMYIEIRGINYKIERNFHRDTRSTKITDIDNGKIIKENEWISILSPMDYETFTSTCYINSESSNPGAHFMKLLQEKIIGLAQSSSGDILVHESIHRINNEQKNRRIRIKELSNPDAMKKIEEKKEIEEKISQLEIDKANINSNLEFPLTRIVSIYIISAILCVLSLFINHIVKYPLIALIIFIAIIYNILLFKKIRQKNSEINEKSNYINGQLKELEISLDRCNSIIQTTNENNAKISELERELEALQLARDTINKIAKDMYSKNTNELNTSLSKLFSTLTDNSFKGVFVNDDMNIYAVKNDNTLFSLEHLSRGTLEQLYLSLRIVTIYLIYNELQLPIIIDDGFVHYDYKRYKNTITMLEKLSNQVIIFNLSKSVF